MSEVSLEKVKQMIEQLSAEDRKKLIPFMAELPDSEIHSYDLREELETLKKHGIRLTGPDNNPDYYLVNLVFVRNLVSVQILDTEVLRAVFFPDNFVKAFSKSNGKPSIMAARFKRSYFTEERKKALRAEQAAQGIQESDEEFEAAINETCNSIGEYLMTEKAERIAEQISLHLPGMIGDMVCGAIKGQAAADYNALCEQVGKPERKKSTEELKKLIQKSAWKEVKPHLGVTHGGNRRTDSAWQGNEVLITYARRVNERHPLAESIKAMYEDCLGDEGWIEDLHLDSIFQKLSQAVPKEIIDLAIRQAASEETMSKREREPLSIACEMARQELKLPEQDVETLRTYYGEGKKLIQQNRSKRGK